VSITILFVLAPIGAIVAWWLSRQRLTAKPWLEVGAIDDFPGTGASSLPAATIGLGVFLAVVSSLFALFTWARTSSMSSVVQRSSNWMFTPFVHSNRCSSCCSAWTRACISGSLGR
jgi:cytochrome c oxidase subunit 3